MAKKTKRNLTIGQRLKEERQRLQMTQEELAEMLNISYQSYQRYEREKTNIPIDIMQLLHNKFHTDLNYLLCGTDKDDIDTERIKRLAIELLRTIDREYHTSICEGLPIINDYWK